MDVVQIMIETLGAFISDFKITYLIDILLIAFVFYKLLGLIRETRAEQIIKGFGVIFVISKISEYLSLYSVNYILRNAFTVGLIAIVIIFQPELRKALERVGTAGWLLNKAKRGNAITDQHIAAIVEAATTMSRKKIGAIMVLVRSIGLSDIVETGTALDAEISPELIMNVFFPKSPLHDGAMVLNHDRIVAAGCLLPLTSNQSISKELGTRHRAAIGITETTDAFVIIVSEETGAISIAQGGDIQRFLDANTLTEMLKDRFTSSKEMES